MSDLTRKQREILAIACYGEYVYRQADWRQRSLDVLVDRGFLDHGVLRHHIKWDDDMFLGTLSKGDGKDVYRLTDKGRAETQVKL